MNNKIFARTSSFHFFKKYWQPIIKFSSKPVATGTQDSLLARYNKQYCLFFF